MIKDIWAGFVLVHLAVEVVAVASGAWDGDVGGVDAGSGLQTGVGSGVEASVAVGSVGIRVSAITEVGVQDGGIGLSLGLTLANEVAGGAGDGHVSGVDARGGLGQTVAVEATVAVGAVAESQTQTVAVVSVEEGGVSLGDGSSHNSGKEDLE